MLNAYYHANLGDDAKNYFMSDMQFREKEIGLFIHLYIYIVKAVFHSIVLSVLKYRSHSCRGKYTFFLSLLKLYKYFWNYYCQFKTANSNAMIIEGYSFNL